MKSARWTEGRARAWSSGLPWLVGCNFFPSYAVNPLEMWQGDTFDLGRIDRELALAQGLGFNTVRTNLHSFVYRDDGRGLLARLDGFLAKASARGIRTMLCFFDDCAHSGKQPKAGTQDDPVPGVHNSQWTPSPAHAEVTDPGAWPALKLFVQGVMEAHSHDPRVLCWDLYNEPGNGGLGNKSLPFLNEVFGWAREANPDQPLTVGPWSPEFEELNQASLELSDVVSFHNYGPLEELRPEVERLSRMGRPLFCTEYMARPRGSLFETHLPFFKEKKIACYNWGLVNGRTQTQFPWGSAPGAPDPDPWFHDIFRRDGSSYKASEAEAIRKITFDHS